MRSSLKLATFAALGCAAFVSAVGACSGDDSATGSQATQSGSGAGSSTGSSQGGGGGTASGNPTAGGEFNPSTGSSDGGLDPDSACAASATEATLTKKPVDIIFIIDNSGSMGDDILAVQNNINDNFAAIIGASGIDYRVIMIATHGPNGDESVCIKAPLSATDCNPVPAQPAPNPPIFYQYSVEIGSHDSVCKAMSSYDGTLKDGFGLGPNGWKEWLRPEAVKVFLEITDDGMTCNFGGKSYDDNDNINDGDADAIEFDAALLALDPLQFGDANKRNYIWHSIIGVKENNPPTAPYLPADPIIAQKCSTADGASPGPGTAYQALSKLTGGLRFPICQNQSFDVVFQEIAKGVIEGAKVACDLEIPKPPEGETIDLSTLVVQYTPGDMGPIQKFKQVKSAAECVADSFYLENELIKLCPAVCDIVQKDDKAKIAILYGCDPGQVQ